ncbi:hypothetical protein BDN71DRAFT_1500171, partial [Pleurotus eryngii]
MQPESASTPTTRDEWSEGSTSRTTSAWDKPTSSLSSLPPPPSSPSPSLPSGHTPAQPNADVVEDDDEKEKQVLELQERWGQRPDPRCCAKHLPWTCPSDVDGARECRRDVESLPLGTGAGFMICVNSRDEMWT